MQFPDALYVRVPKYAVCPAGTEMPAFAFCTALGVKTILLFVRSCTAFVLTESNAAPKVAVSSRKMASPLFCPWTSNHALHSVKSPDILNVV